MKELFPPDGPVRTKILGKVDNEKTERAERKRDYMNWQITEQIEEFRDEQEQLYPASAWRLTVLQDLVRRAQEASGSGVPAHRPCDPAICSHQLLYRPTCR
jgi:hypothetical protein